MYTAIPTRYALRLDPNLSRFEFAGNVTIDCTANQTDGSSTTSVVLDAVDLQIGSVDLTIGGSTHAVPFRQEPEQLVIDLDRPVSGPFAVTIAYTGEINDSMAGFYRSRYTQAGEERFLAVTQFEERDARRAFPCVDHPAYKAVFAIDIVTDAGHIAIANTPEAGAEPLDADSAGESPATARIVRRFEPTPPMSTYLVFFGVGPFECLVDDSWRVPIRVAVSPGKAKYAARALEYGRSSLSFLEEYTGIPYPLGKMDLIGVSDFAYGAMENFGAILYRENYVLTYPESTTRRDTERMMGITAHEVAHMWFGDLVSPADWRYVWLNEAFATYFGNIVVDHYYPQWRTMDQMVLGGTGAAMERDGLARTIPIEFRDGVEVNIDASSAPIIYAKGASILAMARGFYGDEAFRSATNRFLSEYAFACADTGQFLSAFTAQLDDSAPRMLEDFIRKPGFPVVSVRRDGETLVLRQSRFSYTENDADSGGQRWRIPVTGVIAGDKPDSGGSFRVWLTGESLTERLAAPWLKLNAGQRGYYRVYYESPDDWERLGNAAARGELGARDRYGLVSDLNAFVGAGRVSLERYLEFLESHFSDEDEFLVISVIAESLSSYHELFEGDDRITACGRSILDRFVAELIAEPSEAEPYRNVLLRDPVLSALAGFGHDEVVQTSLARMRALVTGGQVHPDLFPVTLRCAVAADVSYVPWVQDELDRKETTESRKAHLLAALGAARAPERAHEILEYVIESVPYRNRLFFFRVAGSNPAYRSHLWPWFRAHFDELSGIHPYHLGSTIAQVVPFGGLGREEEVGRFMDEYRSNGLPVSSGVLDLALDRLELNRRLIARRTVGNAG